MLIKISVDLMGGENAPVCILEAAENFSDVHFVFSGTAQCKNLLQRYKIQNYDFILVDHCLSDGVKHSNQELEKSSLYSAIMQVKNGAADCVLSGGTSVYYLLLAKRLFGTIGNIARPALAAQIPTVHGRAIMLDLGANLECTTQDFVNFAIMGAALAKFWLNVDNPKIGFLNIGSEFGKGPLNIQNAIADFTKIYDLECHFAEGGDILFKNYDVIVTDGFTGNCLLKFAESVPKFLKSKIVEQFNKNIFTCLIGLMSKNILKKATIDGRIFNGAIFAGFNECAIKSHGSADKIGYKAAIEFAKKIAVNKNALLQVINEGFKKYSF